jgi:transcriptional regulator NrdR family protein
MDCPSCGINAFQIEDSRQHKNLDGCFCVVIRRRRCANCGHEQHTTESIEKTTCSTTALKTTHMS